MQTIKRGDAGMGVRVLQFLLGISASGRFDDATENALLDRQKALALPANGVCDAVVWAAIAAKLPLVKLSSAGNPVKAAQTLLGLPVTGLCDAATVAAVKRMQAAAGLVSDGKVGPITWGYLLTKYVLPTVPVQPSDFKQYDRRWAKTMYSANGNTAQTMKNSGCGPTAMADILSTWKDVSLTPVGVAKMAVDNGFCTNGHGTARAFFGWVAKKYGFSRYQRTYSTDEAIAALKGGAYVVALMGKGYWTGGGHYICCWKYDAKTDRIYANDPASATRKSAVSKVFREQRKEYFIYFK